MTARACVVALCEMVHGQESDLFALLTVKELLATRDGKPYHRVGFRDARREVSFPIWQDSPWAEDCKQSWTPGICYKLRALYRETNYGPQLEIRKIRAVNDADRLDGYDPQMFLPRSRFDPAQMLAELEQLVEAKVGDAGLRRLTLAILTENREKLLALPAATRNHHAYVGGWLEHVLSVTRTAVYLAEKYDDYYPDLQPRLNGSLVVAGAVLHDIGKLCELEWQAEGAAMTASGALIGHILQGRDLVREAAARQAAAGQPVDAERLLRLEHVIVSHQRLPEWGSPKPPMTPEALLVHYADDLDAKYQMYYGILRDDALAGTLTSAKNVLTQRLYRGPRES
ncbi:MAG TPA: HD domain-containing protein [Pirellulales bacterium]|nr:HD domain-containing protein [Pirellulales bacterium]